MRCLPQRSAGWIDRTILPSTQQWDVCILHNVLFGFTALMLTNSTAWQAHSDADCEWQEKEHFYAARIISQKNILWFHVSNSQLTCNVRLPKVGWFRIETRLRQQCHFWHQKDRFNGRSKCRRSSNKKWTIWLQMDRNKRRRWQMQVKFCKWRMQKPNYSRDSNNVQRKSLSNQNESWSKHQNGVHLLTLPCTAKMVISEHITEAHMIMRSWSRANDFVVQTK